jgi:hypothetical protein
LLLVLFCTVEWSSYVRVVQEWVWWNFISIIYGRTDVRNVQNATPPPTPIVTLQVPTFGYNSTIQ